MRAALQDDVIDDVTQLGNCLQYLLDSGWVFVNRLGLGTLI